MSVAEAVMEKLRALPPQKQEQVLHYVETLADVPPKAKDTEANPYEWLKIAANMKKPDGLTILSQEMFMETCGNMAVDKITGMNLGLKPSDFRFDLRYVGPGYGVPSEGCLAAIETLARTEGIFLDPVYSGKAFHGLIEMARNGEINGRVCFWHTGGSPALFAME